MGAWCAGLGVVLSILLAGCAARTDAGAGATIGKPSASEVAKEPTPATPEDGIPDDFVLPGQADGEVVPDTDVGRLYDYICLDPQELWTLGSGFVEARTVVHAGSAGDGAATIEKLAAYPTAARAVEAVRGLRVQVDLCGDGIDHAGGPMTWRATDVATLPAADEALRLTYRSDGVVSTVVTVARVGRAVYFVDRREQLADGVQIDERAMAELVPTLEEVFD